MLHDLIDSTLEEFTAEELSRLDWAVDVWERAGQMTASEAVEWRERIEVRLRLRAHHEDQVSKRPLRPVLRFADRGPSLR
jgi:hypothetical protein